MTTRRPPPFRSSGSSSRASLSAPSAAATFLTPQRSSSRRVPALNATTLAPAGSFSKCLRPWRTAVGLMNTARSTAPEGRTGASGSISMAGKRYAWPPAASIRPARPPAREAGRVTTTPFPLRPTQDLFRALASQILGRLLAQGLGFFPWADDVRPRDAAPIGRRHERPQAQVLAALFRERAKRNRAAAAESAAHGALSAHAERHRCVDERRKQRGDVRSRLEAFDAERALAGRRQAVLRVEARADALAQAEPDQSGDRQDHGVVLAAVELGEARLDVATQQLRLQVWMALEYLRRTPQAGSSYHRSFRHFPERRKLRGDKRVSWILALEDGGDAEARRQLGRQVLHRVHRELRAAVGQRVLQLLHEQALA